MVMKYGFILFMLLVLAGCGGNYSPVANLDPAPKAAEEVKPKPKFILPPGPPVLPPMPPKKKKL
jgi:PBP1b-binding outer membrane lipoprotein LpoB